MSGAKDVRPGRLYTRDHEWAIVNGKEILVGITSFAVEQLGDITLVDLSATPGQRLEAHQAFGTIESVKTLSDLFSPVSGTVLRINQELLDHPEWVNEDCWDKGWMVALEPDKSISEATDLLDADRYSELLEQAS
jgi:glycine cleavage system H protein